MVAERNTKMQRNHLFYGLLILDAVLIVNTLASVARFFI